MVRAVFAQDLSRTRDRDTRSIMEPWAREMLDVWEAKIPEIAEATAAENRGLVGGYTAEDFAQMIRGARAMMAEELEGQPTGLREEYFDTVVPGVVAQGEKVTAMAASDISMAIRIAIAVLPTLSPQNKAAATEFFVEWQAKLLVQLIEVALAAGAKT